MYIQYIKGIYPGKTTKLKMYILERLDV